MLKENHESSYLGRNSNCWEFQGFELCIAWEEVEIVIGAKQFPCQIYLNVVVSSCGLTWDSCKKNGLIDAKWRPWELIERCSKQCNPPYHILKMLP